MKDKVTDNRRTALKTMLVGAGVTTASRAGPAKWRKPLIESILLPAHAATTPGATTTPGVTTTTIAPCTPDLTPSLVVIPSIFIGNTRFHTTIQIFELLGCDTFGEITVRIPKDIRITLDTSSISAPGWVYTDGSTSHIFTTSKVLNAYAIETFEFYSNWGGGVSSGNTTYTVQIDAGSGGEVNASNNSDSESIDYFVS